MDLSSDSDQRRAGASVLGDAGAIGIAGFLAAEDCAWLIDDLCANPGSATTISVSENLAMREVDTSFARSKTAEGSPGGHWIVRHAVDRHLAALERFFGPPLESSPELAFRTYGVGDFIRPHVDRVDGEDVPERISERVAVFSVFLNDSYTGGEFVLHPEPDRALTIAPKAGALLAFRADLAHSVNPVLSGARFAVTGWLRERAGGATGASSPG